MLFISGSIGLGHAARDLAIADELRRIRPDAEIAWLAADPARTLIADAGETLLPEAAELSEDTFAAEQAAGGFGLNIPRYLWRARRSWKSAVTTFERVRRPAV